MRMLDGLRDELRPLLDQFLVEAQGTPALTTATRINALLILAEPAGCLCVQQVDSYPRV